MNGDALLWLPDVLRAAGLVVVEYDGWEDRARSSGGFTNGRPFAVFWHHTASQASPENDASYCCYGSPDRPITNLLFPRDGTAWVLAAGATNTNGKGKRIPFSRGVVEADSANTSVIGCEISNSGLGEPYPVEQIDAMFAASNALNAHLGNLPGDLSTHHFYAADRKIDPATASAVGGPWQPRSINSSGTWDRDDIIAEAFYRSVGIPPQPPEPPTTTKEVTMLALDFGNPPGGPNPPDSWWTRLTYTGDTLCHVRSPFDQVQARGGITVESVSEEELSAMLDTVTTVGPSPFGPGQAPNPGLDAKWNDARGRG